MEITKDEKKCPSCEKIKLTTEFNKDKSKKDGLRNYCKECEKDQYLEKKRKKEMGILEDGIAQIINITPKDTKKELEITKDRTEVDELAKTIVKQYDEDLQKADEVFDLFMEKITHGDNTEASKEALTKSLELRMSASESIARLIQIAAKLQESREKNKSKGNGISTDNIKNFYNLEEE